MGDRTDWVPEQDMHKYISLQYSHSDGGGSVMLGANWQSQWKELGRIKKGLKST